MRKNRRPSLLTDDDGDPLSGVVNLFDVAMVFAVSLMVAMVMHLNMSEAFGKEDFTIVKNPGQANMEIIRKKGQKIENYKARPAVRHKPAAQKVADWVQPTSWKTAALSMCPTPTPSYSPPPKALYNCMVESMNP